MGLRVFNCKYSENRTEEVFESSEDNEWNPYVIKYIEMLLDDDDEEKEMNPSIIKQIENMLEDEGETQEEAQQETQEETQEEIQFEKLSSGESSSYEDEKEINIEDKNKEGKNKKKESRYTLVTKRIDVNKIRHKTSKSTEVFASVLKNVTVPNDGPVRSGAIVYTHYKGKTYFCLGIDTTYGDLTDFGGGVKKDESPIEGGLRELEEESLGIFGKISYKEVEDAMTIYSSNILVMFIRRELNMEEVKKNFLLKKAGKDTEVSNISWLEKKEFLDSINGKTGNNNNKLYSRVKRILLKTIDIIAAL